MAKSVERETRAQSKSNLWITYRAGRIIASRMKSVCHTDSTNPSQSLVKLVSYPVDFKFSSKATSWGCKHEKKVRDFYVKTMKKNHPRFSMMDSGLTINPKWSYIGASPDSVVNCDCCGQGVMEIKCPYCHRNDGIAESSEDKRFFLKRNSDGACYLDHTHAYYYQIQTQMF